MEVQHHPFLISTLVEGELYSCCICFTPEEITPSTHWRGGWMDPRVSLDTLERGKIFVPSGNQTTNPWLGQPDSNYTNYSKRIIYLKYGIQHSHQMRVQNSQLIWCLYEKLQENKLAFRYLQFTQQWLQSLLSSGMWQCCLMDRNQCCREICCLHTLNKEAAHSSRTLVPICHVA
jgi:hypothetical protein